MNPREGSGLKKRCEYREEDKGFVYTIGGRELSEVRFLL
jgi:hypothetical protein